MRSVVYKILPIVERAYLHIFRKHRVVDVVNLFFQAGNNFAGVATFTHHHNTFHDIRVIVAAHLSKTWQGRLRNVCYGFYVDRCSVEVVDNNIPDFFHVV